jgi:DNA-binding transcriptional LysR family regulator
MFDLRALEVFYWVVKLGGFGRAAERLHMTQPAVSGRISQIEARCGQRLLDRAASRAAAPTAKGMELFAYAERMLSLRAEMEAMLAGGSARSGIIRIGVAETLVHTLVGRFIQRLHQLYPGVTPEITVDISPSLQAMLLDGALDLALLLGPLNEPRVRNVVVGEYDLVWVASPALQIGEGRLGLADLGRCSTGRICRRCGFFPAAAWPRSFAWRWMGSGLAWFLIRWPVRGCGRGGSGCWR